MLKRGNGEKSTILLRISQGAHKCLVFGGLNFEDRGSVRVNIVFLTFFKTVAHSLSRQRLRCDSFWWKLWLHPPCGHCKYFKKKGLFLHSLPVIHSDHNFRLIWIFFLGSLQWCPCFPDAALSSFQVNPYCFILSIISCLLRSFSQNASVSLFLTGYVKITLHGMWKTTTGWEINSQTCPPNYRWQWSVGFLFTGLQKSSNISYLNCQFSALYC